MKRILVLVTAIAVASVCAVSAQAQGLSTNVTQAITDMGNAATSAYSAITPIVVAVALASLGLWVIALVARKIRGTGR
jgi:hypothetical protein